MPEFTRTSHPQFVRELDLFLTSVTMAPLFAAGFRMLGQIARFEHDARLHGGDDPETRPMPELQPRPEALAGVAPEELITLVSGLPRGGRLQ